MGRERASMKAPTGILGLDTMTDGGLPAGRLTVVSGQPGLGKTILSLQFLASGGDGSKAPGLFVAFEEIPDDVVQNARRFGWNADLVRTSYDQPGSENSPKILVIAANPSADIVQAGDFDLGGLLAVVTGVIHETGANRVVLDGIDVLLDLLDSPAARRREILRLRDWSIGSNVTTIVTSKPLDDAAECMTGYDFLRYIACGFIMLRRHACGRAGMRTIEVVKLRGSGHSTSQHPFIIAQSGLVIGDVGDSVLDHPVGTGVVSSGIAELDVMLGGGYLSGSSILVSGAPGTAKTTLSGSFVAAACERGEKALYISFDEPPQQIERNLSSVGIEFRRHSKVGRLVTLGFRTGRLGPEEHFHRIVQAVASAGPQVVVLDPISALVPVVQEELAGHLAERLIDHLKKRGITVLLTSLLEGPSTTNESARAHVSSIADSWLHLSFAVRGGERNRALTIIKSRGLAHSSQVRELILSRDGVSLTAVYSASGEVLMGSARLEKEQEEEAEDVAARLRFEAERAQIAHVEAAARLRLDVARTEIEALTLRAQTMEQGEIARRAEQQRARTARLSARNTG